MTAPADDGPRGTRLRGRCPVCGATRNLRTLSRSGVPLAGAIMAIHNRPRPTRICSGSGRPPVSVVSG
jgi:hypothetical protein